MCMSLRSLTKTASVKVICFVTQVCVCVNVYAFKKPDKDRLGQGDILLFFISGVCVHLYVFEMPDKDRFG